jgi:putative DNA methylase
LKGQPKRLIEVDLPIKRISEHARREKNIRHGHISTLHIWWARRPLAACRAVICAALWPDPADPLCPESFRRIARQWMMKWSSLYLKSLGQESYGRFIQFQNDPSKLENNDELRCALLDFIADFASWDNSTLDEYLETSRALTQSAHEALGGAPGTRPLVADPFAGGGSIPLEALRVGADAFASDLNPIPVLLNKVALEYIPKYGKRLADEVSKWGDWIKRESAKELSQFYPKDADGATPIAYLWARTIQCEGPGCGAEVPMVRSPWVISTDKLKVALVLCRGTEPRQVAVKVVENPKTSDVVTVVRRGSATCPVCGFTTLADNVRKQFITKRGGASSARMLAVVTMRDGKRSVRHACKTDSDVFLKAKERLETQLKNTLGDGASWIPDEPLPYLRSIFNIQLLGVKTWGDLFNARQALTIGTLASKVRQLDKELFGGDADFIKAVKTVLAFAVDKQADSNSSLCGWRSTSQDIGHTFGRQALPIVWDYVECNVFSGATRDWSNAVEGTLKAIDGVKGIERSGISQKASATQQVLPDDSSALFFTDPPYYDLVPYADLSDFFYVWLKRMIPSLYPDLFSEQLTPKREEIVQLAERNQSYAYKTKANYEQLMQRAMEESRRVLQPSGLGVVVFAHKGTDVWEIQLEAMVKAGWVICASWPIDTEMGSRLRARNSAVLASSVHLVCRPRESPGAIGMNEIGDWRNLLHELPLRIHEWMPRLAEEGVVGADAIFACLGPALEIYSRYSSVEKASGEIVGLREYLEQVWAAVAKEALTLVFKGADASGFEEDARLTAMWLWTLFAGQSGANGLDEETDVDAESGETGGKQAGFVLEYDAARKIAQGLGAHLESLSSLVEVKGEVARLLPVSERTRRLFGADESESPTKIRKKKKVQLQLGFVAELEQAEEAGSWGSKGAPTLGSTVLDRVHQSMILFAAGRGEALRRFLVDEGVGRDERFWRLAQVLSFLYPKTSDEKRWIDGVLARKKGLGF